MKILNKIRFSLLMLGFVVALLGCTANDNSIFRTYKADSEERVAIIDAKQRVILSNTVKDKLNGNGIEMAQDITRFCVEPSPDVFTVLSSSFATSASFSKSSTDRTAAANIAQQISESGATISRTQTIQTLRELMFRLCERYMNGALSKDEFMIQAGRDHRIIVSILAIEQLTNAVRPEPVRIQVSSSAEAGADLTRIGDELSKARVEHDKIKKSRDEMSKDYEEASTAHKLIKEKLEQQKKGGKVPEGEEPVKDSDVEEAKDKSDKAKSDLALAESHLNDSQLVINQLTELLKTPGIVSVSSETIGNIGKAQTIPANVTEKVADAISEIVNKNLDIDEVTLACIRIMKNKSDSHTSNISKSPPKSGEKSSSVANTEDSNMIGFCTKRLAAKELQEKYVLDEAQAKTEWLKGMKEKNKLDEVFGKTPTSDTIIRWLKDREAKKQLEEIFGQIPKSGKE